MLTPVEIARIAAIQAEIAAGNYVNGAELQTLLAKQAAGSSAAPSGLTNDLFMSSTVGTSNGAEPIAFGLYSFVPAADGRPTLIGGKYDAAGKIERELYDAPGQSYHGKPRNVYMLVRHNGSGNEFRLNAQALQNALKATNGASQFNATGMDLKQEVAENAGGYKVASVSLVP